MSKESKVGLEGVPPRRKYSKEFKEEAVRLSNEVGPTAAARQLSVGSSMLSKWRMAQSRMGKDAFRGNGNRAVLEKENYELKKQVRELTMEKEILKKASAYFAKNLV